MSKENEYDEGECINADGIIGEAFIECRDKCEKLEKENAQLQSAISQLQGEQGEVIAGGKVIAIDRTLGKAGVFKVAFEYLDYIKADEWANPIDLLGQQVQIILKKVGE